VLLDVAVGHSRVVKCMWHLPHNCSFQGAGGAAPLPSVVVIIIVVGICICDVIVAFILVIV